MLNRYAYFYKNVLLLVIGGLACVGVALASPPAGKVSKLKGNADVLRGTAPAQALKKDDPIFPEDTVRTKARSRIEIVLNDGSKLKLGANAKANLSQYTLAKEPEGVIDLLRGKLRLFVTDTFAAKPESFKTKTSTAVVGVHGTDFLVQAEPRKTTIMVYGGVVAVRNINSAIPGQLLLRANEAGIVRKGQAPERIGAIPGEEDTGSGGHQYRRNDGLQGADPSGLAPAQPPAIPLPDRLAPPD